MPSSKPLVRLQDIQENATRILNYIDGLSLDQFLVDTLVQDAVERCLTRISEAAVKLGPLGGTLLPDHDWRKIRAIGSVFRHDYDKVELRQVWLIAQDIMPKLKTDIDGAILSFDERER
ncbi:DUF86 domain-containing protein [Rhizobium sp. YIM 134829]|uniref:HepT-like ribonuclease domain-containing protein n=1 Tax=Rhizobium sp. YIM 134829 TaxID=3390453 RepID=UPI00397BA10D